MWSVSVETFLSGERLCLKGVAFGPQWLFFYWTNSHLLSQLPAKQPRYKEVSHQADEFPGGSVIKNLPANAEDAGSIPGSGRSSGGRNGKPLEYSWWGNPMDREKPGRRATICPISKNRTWLSNWAHPHNLNLMITFYISILYWNDLTKSKELIFCLFT